LIEQVVQILSADNLELGCSLIEQAVVEKVLRDIENTIQPALVVRRQARERGVPFVDANYIKSSSWTLNLPEPLKLRPVLNNRQLQVYKDFMNFGPLKKLQQESVVVSHHSSSPNTGGGGAPGGGTAGGGVGTGSHTSATPSGATGSSSSSSTSGAGGGPSSSSSPLHSVGHHQGTSGVVGMRSSSSGRGGGSG
ncbi:ccr4-not complex not1 protein, partial [Cystoisospora suis]